MTPSSWELNPINYSPNSLGVAFSVFPQAIFNYDTVAFPHALELRTHRGLVSLFSTTDHFSRAELFFSFPNSLCESTLSEDSRIAQGRFDSIHLGL
jgi:hypothetical protein